jgi:hypothetical protein
VAIILLVLFSLPLVQPLLALNVTEQSHSETPFRNFHGSG